MNSPPLRLVSSMATRLPLAELIEGRGVELESVGGVEAARRVRAGEAFDLVVLASDAIDELCAAGCIVAGSVRGFARSEVAIAVRRGAAPPDIGSEAALRDAVLASATIGYSTGPSGTALLALFERWGIASVIAPRLVRAPPGVPVGALLVRGEVELGFQQRSELMHLDGIDVIGGMPPGTEIVTTFSGGVCSASARADAAQAALDGLAAPAAAEAKRRHGMQPA